MDHTTEYTRATLAPNETGEQKCCPTVVDVMGRSAATGSKTRTSTSSVPRSRRDKRLSGDQRECEILESTERLMQERPFHEISTDAIAAGAGITRPTFYFYFASKDAVLLALLDDLTRRVHDTQ